MESLYKGGHHKGDLHHGEGVADANVRPHAEGEVSIFGDVVRPAGSESVGAESLGPREPARVVLRDIRRNSDQAPPRKPIAANLHLRNRLACEQGRGWRTDAQR